MNRPLDEALAHGRLSMPARWCCSASALPDMIMEANESVLSRKGDRKGTLSSCSSSLQNLQLQIDNGSELFHNEIIS